METGIRKICENCKQYFNCCVNDVENCHCYNTIIPAQVKEIIQQKFKDCLCANCLKQATLNSQ